MNQKYDDNTLPTISIITVARNMEHLVGETIRSVVSQKRAGDQYVFVDGASTDTTVEIARAFGDGIDVLISEPDDGQYHAIAKGFEHATGDIQAWLNADDVYMPWTFSVVREVFARFPEVKWITGIPSFMSSNGQLVRTRSKLAAYPRRYIANGWFQPAYAAYMQQENMFWRRELWDKAGTLDLSLSLASDFELWTRFAEHADLVPIDIPLAGFRERPGEQRSSTSRDRYDEEVAKVCSSKRSPSQLWAWVSGRGVPARYLAQLLISARHPAITYDRYNRTWKTITRRRSISRNTLGMLIDEWHMRRVKKDN